MMLKPNELVFLPTPLPSDHTQAVTPHHAPCGFWDWGWNCACAEPEASETVENVLVFMM
jgi:hypothetical protein